MQGAPQCAFSGPWDESDISDFKLLLDKHCDEIAAVILEPIVQGAGGMRFYSPVYLKRAAELCREYGILLILDEIATGFGRTGRLFAFEHAGVEPDIICLGKALTGGYMSLAATLCSDRVAQGVCSGSGAGSVFMHGPTYMANPLACAAACASIDLLMESNWQQRITAIEESLRSGLQGCCNYPLVKDVRVLGAIGVIELFSDVPLAEVQQHLVSRGVWLRPFRNLIYTMPAYICSLEDIEMITQGIEAVVREIISG